MGYEFIRPQSYWDTKTRTEIADAQKEIKRLTKISERQSLMLALALKEKNELGKKRNDTATYWENHSTCWQNQYHFAVKQREEFAERLRISQLDLSVVRTQLNEVKTLATQFFEALGIK